MLKNARVLVCLLLILLLTIGSVGCSNTEQLRPTSTAAPVPVKEKEVTLQTAAPAEPEVMIPAQTVEDNEYAEYRFSGTYDTATMGTATVTADLLYDGTYELVLDLKGMFSNTPSWGDWEYNIADDVFILTDTDNNLSFTAIKNTDSYGFTFDFRGTPIEMSATMTGEKAASALHDGPVQEKEATEDTPAVERTILLEIEGIDHTNDLGKKDGFFFRFYSDHSIAIYLVKRDAESSSGTWSYDEENGLKLTVDDNEIEIQKENGENTFLAAAQLAPGMAFARKYVVSEDELRAALSESKESLTVVAADNRVSRYAAWTEEEWNTLWKEADMPLYTDLYSIKERSSETDNKFIEQLPKEAFDATDARGTVYRLEYDTYIYDYYYSNNIPETEWKPVTKACYIYVPADYDADKQYDVYYLMHGATGSEASWFSFNCDGTYTNVGEGDFIVMLDALTNTGKLMPAIYVSATVNTDVSSFEKKIQNTYSATNELASFPYELVNDLVPAVESRFSTYAEGIAPEQLKASRYHRAFGGLSLGAAVVWNAMPIAYEYIAYYAPLANGCDPGDVEDEYPAAKALGEKMSAFKDVELGFLFASSGNKDHTYAHEYVVYDVLFENWDELRYGENTSNFRPVNGTHSAKYFMLGVFNSMQVFFAEETH